MQAPGLFQLRDWAAFAAGLEHREAWLTWASHPHLPGNDAAPMLVELAPMQRRRVEKLGRMALQVAFWCQSAADAGWPLVFASRHGDLARTYAMLDELARGMPISPTAFGLSTHNAVAAQYTIARGLPVNYLCVSSGRFTAEAALLEAQALLADGAGDVLVVNYDSALPDPYAEFADEHECDFAWAWRVGAPDGDKAMPVFSLTASACSGADVKSSELPHGLEVLRFALSGEQSLEHCDDGRAWRWEKHA